MCVVYVCGLCVWGSFMEGRPGPRTQDRNWSQVPGPPLVAHLAKPHLAKTAFGKKNPNLAKSFLCVCVSVCECCVVLCVVVLCGVLCCVCCVVLLVLFCLCGGCLQDFWASPPTLPDRPRRSAPPPSPGPPFPLSLSHRKFHSFFSLWGVCSFEFWWCF